MVGFGLWTGSAIELDTGVPQMFPDGHNLNDIEARSRVTRGFRVPAPLHVPIPLISDVGREAECLPYQSRGPKLYMVLDLIEYCFFHDRTQRKEARMLRGHFLGFVRARRRLAFTRE